MADCDLLASFCTVLSSFPFCHSMLPVELSFTPLTMERTWIHWRVMLPTHTICNPFKSIYNVYRAGINMHSSDHSVHVTLHYGFSFHCQGILSNTVVGLTILLLGNVSAVVGILSLEIFTIIMYPLSLVHNTMHTVKGSNGESSSEQGSSAPRNQSLWKC